MHIDNNDDKRIIIRCAGEIGKKALEEYGDRVEYFCDDYTTATEIEGVPVISTNELKKIHQDYQVVIARKHFEQKIKLADELKHQGIPIAIYGNHDKFGIPHRTIHIHGVYGELKYDFNDNDLIAEIDRIRAENTMAMYKKMFGVHGRDFEGKTLDIHICIDDDLQQAYEFAKVYDTGIYHAYSTVYALEDVVIPIPDYRSCFDEEDYYYKDATPTVCREAASKPYKDDRAFWIGSIFQSLSRKNLWIMSQKYPEKLLVESSFDRKIPIYEMAKYKYLIDVRGLGWTDRIKSLLMLGRPLLMEDRTNIEWYMPYMTPMKEYVPIREDLSDLIEKIDFLNQNPEVYDNIVNNAKEFVQQYLMPEPILEYLRDVTLKYDVV